MTEEQASPDPTHAALEESRRELESLTYTIAHDLRAPLRTIDGFARALSEDCGAKLDEEGRRYLQHVLDGAQRMSAMLEGLLSLARVMRADFHPGPVDVSNMARDIVQRLQAADPSRPIEVLIPQGILAEGDPSLLAIALEALLQNAWKFTRGREPARIELGVQPRIPPVHFLRDNGAGFDMRHAEKLFGVFQRLHSTREFEGVGIGLATAQRIIRRHGGRIWAEAAAGQGATFYFTLKETAAR